MCLRIEKGSRLRTAKEDITVYKLLEKICPRTKPHYPEGFFAPFKGVINDIACRGTAVFQCGELYFCTDKPELDGCNVSDKKGHLYSWVFDDNVDVDSVIIGGAPIAFVKYEYMTPYMGMNVKIGETYESKLNRNRDEVNEGFHSYARTQNVRKIHYGRVVAECVIPKGAKYYIGEFNDYVSYASDRLRYVRIVEPKNK